MKFLLLRHEEKYDDCLFLTDLTSIGKMNSNTSAIHQLKKYKINKIYSSPFLCTLQTIYPYCLDFIKSDADKINIDYSIYQHIKNKEFTVNNWKNTHYDIINSKFTNIINNSYKSIISINDIKFRETDNDLFDRVYFFINKIFKEYGCKNVNILLVSHKSVINMIKYIIDGITKIDDEFPQGYLEVLWLKKKNKLFTSLI